MKVNLLFKDGKLKRQEPDSTIPDLVQDFGLNIIADNMSSGDEFIKNVCLQVLIEPLFSEEGILYRQEIVKEAIEHINIFKELYELSVEVLESKKKSFFWMLSKKPSGVLFSNVRMMENLIGFLGKLKNLVSSHLELLSTGMKNFFERVKENLTDEYMSELNRYLNTLEFRGGILFSAKLGVASRLDSFIPRYREQERAGIFKVFSKNRGYSFTIDERDEAGFRALSEIKDKALIETATILYRAVSGIVEFFETLKKETAFYIGAYNLYKTIKQKGYPVCFPKINKPFNREFSGLIDLSLMLVSREKIVGNGVDLKNKKAVFITGANQGGKTTFLRSIGVAQILFQAGLFVPAENFSSHINSGIFTHFKREEDTSLKSGKLDDELKRMDKIADRLKKCSLVLMNESFASTNEQEGSDIAKQVVSAFLENGVEVFYVTHMYTLAKSFLSKDGVEFLVAEVNEKGERTYRIKPGKPLQTSFGKDLFKKIFEES